MASPETTSRADLAQVERAIREVLLGADEMVLTYLEQVAQGIGKRLRPQMLITFADLFGNSRPDSVVNCAACSELLHTASLIHDDVIDTAESRRGLPTINGRHGNEIAVIVGDYLLALVFQRLIAMQDIKLLKLVVTASQHLGIGIIEEVRNRNNLALSEEDYTNIIRLKTGALFALVCEMGAYLGGANEEQQAGSREYGHFFGLAFQVLDDLLDFTLTDAEAGKPTFSDLREGRITLPLIYARNTDEARTRTLVELFQREPTPSNAENIRHWFAECGSLLHSLTAAEELLERGRSEVKKMEKSFAHPELASRLKTLEEQAFARVPAWVRKNA